MTSVFTPKSPAFFSLSNYNLNPQLFLLKNEKKRKRKVGDAKSALALFINSSEGLASIIYMSLCVCLTYIHIFKNQKTTINKRR